MNEDFLDFLRELLDSDARFLVVGAHALAVHGVPRATEDIYVWIERNSTNAQHVWEALLRFGAPVSDLGLSPADFERAEHVIQLGLPPRRIDILTDVSGLSFDAAWPRRVDKSLHALTIPFLGKDDLIANKRAAGRMQDLADVEALGE